MGRLANAPRLQRGALIGIDPGNPLASTTIFQYNPEELSRNLQAQTSAEGGDRSEALRLKGAPIETLSLKVMLDATDQLESGETLATTSGIYPQLSALEMLIYPKSSQVILNTTLLAAGTLQVIPPLAPLTLFVWGGKRTLPVRVQGIHVLETAYDQQLNPIRAEVSLELRTLTYDDVSVFNPVYHLFLAHQILKETMGTLNQLNNVSLLAQ